MLSFKFHGADNTPITFHLSKDSKKNIVSLFIHAKGSRYFWLCKMWFTMRLPIYQEIVTINKTRKSMNSIELLD